MSLTVTSPCGGSEEDPCHLIVHSEAFTLLGTNGCVEADAVVVPGAGSDPQAPICDCNDGIWNGDEEGPDCGGLYCDAPCPAPCPCSLVDMLPDACADGDYIVFSGGAVVCAPPPNGM